MYTILCDKCEKEFEVSPNEYLNAPAGDKYCFKCFSEENHGVPKSLLGKVVVFSDLFDGLCKFKLGQKVKYKDKPGDIHTIVGEVVQKAYVQGKNSGFFYAVHWDNRWYSPVVPQESLEEVKDETDKEG